LHPPTPSPTHFTSTPFSLEIYITHQHNKHSLSSHAHRDTTGVQPCLQSLPPGSRLSRIIFRARGPLVLPRASALGLLNDSATKHVPREEPQQSAPRCATPRLLQDKNTHPTGFGFGSTSAPRPFCKGGGGPLLSLLSPRCGGALLQLTSPLYTQMTSSRHWGWCSHLPWLWYLTSPIHTRVSPNPRFQSTNLFHYRTRKGHSVTPSRLAIQGDE